jgi:hypothetical protein
MKRLFCFLFLVVSVAVGAQAPTKPYDFSRTDPVSSSKINQNFDLLYDWSAVASAAIDAKSDSGHLHDDRYYTETESDIRFAAFSHAHAYLSDGWLSSRTIGDANAADSAGLTAYYLNGSNEPDPASPDFALLTQSYNNAWSTQMASDWRTNKWFVRTQNSGTWGTWAELWHSGNAPYLSLNAWGGLRNMTPYGYIDFGPANADWAHIYTDRPAFSFNKELYRIGYKMWDAGNDGSGSGLDADTLDGYHLSTTRNSANTVPVRDSSGYINLGWINTTSGSAGTTAPDRIYGSYDSFLRYYTPANLATVMEPYLDDHFWQAGNDGSGSGLDADLLDGNHASAFALRNLWRHASPFTNGNSSPRVFNPAGLSTAFIESSYGWPVYYGQVLNIPSYTNTQDGAAMQIVSPYAQSYTDGGRPIYRVGKYDNAGWTEWRTIADVETTAKQPCSFYIPGLYTASEVIARFVAPRTVTLPSGCSGSYANLETAHSSAITFGIYKNTTLVGTINFGASSTTATFTLSSSQTFSAGDTLVIKAPGSVTNAAGLTLSLMLTHDL